MTANVSITTGHRDDALRIPVRALRFRPEQAAGRPADAPPTRAAAAPAVYVVAADGSLRRVEVKPGLRDAQHVELLGGELREGDQVALAVRREASDAGPQRPPSFAGGGRRF
jgi:multidrug efflux pump subunit AcrA (membrane-fusion protein)